MKKIIKIGTLNCQNNRNNRSSSDNYNMKGFFENQNFDILGIQEMTPMFEKKVVSKKYNLYGGYRFGKNVFSKIIPIFKNFNENNKILTKYQAKNIKTYKLPWVPTNFRDFKKAIKRKSMMPRIATLAIINVGGIKVCSINTHLDFGIKSIQYRQLNYLKSIIRLYRIMYPIILSGDFNMEYTDKVFSAFIKYMNKKGYKRVEVNDKTNAEKYKNKTAIDHIFIPSNWEIKECGIYSDETLENITDHKEVYALVEIK